MSEVCALVVVGLKDVVGQPSTVFSFCCANSHHLVHDLFLPAFAAMLAANCTTPCYKASQLPYVRIDH
jgi:hypothetical protein